MLKDFGLAPTVLYIIMSNFDVRMLIFYGNAMASFLCFHPEPWIRNIITEEIIWENVRNVEQTFLSQRKLGKWPEDQIKQANACNLKSAYANAQNARPLSAKS